MLVLACANCCKKAAAELNEVQVETEPAKHVPDHDTTLMDKAVPHGSLGCLWSCFQSNVHEVFEFDCNIL